MKKLFRIASLLTALFAAALLSGCSLMPSEKDAGEYVMAAMDIICKGGSEHGKNIDGAKSLLQSREKMIDSAVSAFTGDSADVSAEQVKNIRVMWSEAFSNCKYSLGEISRKDENYLIDVVIEPLRLLKKPADEVVEELTAEVVKDAEFVQNASEDDIAARGIDMLIERIKEDVEDPSYADPVTVTVVYHETGPATYGISDEDGAKLCSALFDMSAFKEYFAK